MTYGGGRSAPWIICSLESGRGNTVEGDCSECGVGHGEACEDKDHRRRVLPQHYLQRD